MENVITLIIILASPLNYYIPADGFSCKDGILVFEATGEKVDNKDIGEYCLTEVTYVSEATLPYHMIDVIPSSKKARKDFTFQ